MDGIITVRLLMMIMWMDQSTTIMFRYRFVINSELSVGEIRLWRMDIRLFFLETDMPVGLNIINPSVIMINCHIIIVCLEWCSHQNFLRSKCISLLLIPTLRYDFYTLFIYLLWPDRTNLSLIYYNTSQHLFHLIINIIIHVSRNKNQSHI